MSLPKEAWKKDSLEPVLQDLPPWYNPQVELMTEELVSVQGKEASSYTPSLSTGEGSHHLGQIHQVRHYNSAQNPTEFNLDAATLAFPSGEEQNVPSQSS